MATAEQFVRTLLKSGLLEREQLKEALSEVPSQRRDTPQRIADLLIQSRLLTPYQANKLLQGVSLGLKLGHYHIEAPIGRGGMGTVYLARDTQTDRPLAIKVLSPKRAREGERHLQRFQREMTMSQRLNHPHVANTLEVGVFHGIHFIVMEYIPGQTLAKLVQEKGPLSPPRAARLISEVASALQHAHSQGLVHRDIKPSNIMVTPDDRAKLLDLGLALMLGEVHDDDAEIVGGKGYIVGSAEYMAPEQSRDPTAVDGRADLYALGGVMYFALTGKGPVLGANSKQRIQAHRHLEPTPIQRLNTGVPEALARYVHVLLSKKPEWRPATASAVVKDLQPWAEKPPTPPAPAIDPQAVLRKQAQDAHLKPAEPLAPEADVLAEYFEKAEPTVPTHPEFTGFTEAPKRPTRWLSWSIAGFAVIAMTALLLTLAIYLLGDE